MAKKFLKDRMVSILAALSACFVAGGTLWAYFTLAGINAPVFIIHFNDVSGITEVGSPSMIIFVGVFGLLIVAADWLIAVALDERDPFLGKITAVVGLLFSVLLFIAFAAILNVN